MLGYGTGMSSVRHAGRTSHLPKKRPVHASYNVDGKKKNRRKKPATFLGNRRAMASKKQLGSSEISSAKINTSFCGRKDEEVGKNNEILLEVES